MGGYKTRCYTKGFGVLRFAAALRRLRRETNERAGPRGNSAMRTRRGRSFFLQSDHSIDALAQHGLNFHYPMGKHLVSSLKNRCAQLLRAYRRGGFCVCNSGHSLTPSTSATVRAIVSTMAASSTPRRVMNLCRSNERGWKQSATLL